MLSSKILAVVLMVAGRCSTGICCNPGNCNPGNAHDIDHGNTENGHYEETTTYHRNPLCRPSSLDKGIKCSAVGPTIQVAGGLYSDYGIHYMPLASAYYVARFADALGYQDRCSTNRTFLKELDIITPWSGTSGSTAVDLACGFERGIRRNCEFPNNGYPFLCKGGEGNPGTNGRRLETLSYISILQGSNLRWVLFINCWNAKTPQNPNARPIATSFNVFNLDPKLSKADRSLIIAELRRRGFNTDPSNLIEFDFRTSNC